MNDYLAGLRGLQQHLLPTMRTLFPDEARNNERLAFIFSVLGPLTQYTLILNVIVNDTDFELSGQDEGKPNLMITITLKKVEDLIEA